MLERAKGLLAACLVCVVGLVALRILAFRDDSFQRLDAQVLNHLSEPRWASTTGAVSAALVHIGDLLPVLALLFAICALAIWRGEPRRALAAVVLVAGASLTTQALKATISHARFQPLLGYHQVGATGFPSGHTTAAFSLAFALAIIVPRRWQPATLAVGLCVAAAVGCSVVIQHWHYPSDTIGGLLVAAGWAFAVLAWLRLTEDGASRSSAHGAVDDT